MVVVYVVDWSTYLAIQITYFLFWASWKLTKWSAILLFLLACAIYAGGEKLAGPLGGIGAVLAVVLIPVIIAALAA